MREIEVDYMNINEVFSGLDKLFAENRLPEVERYLCDANGTLSGFVRHFPANETISAIRVGVKPRMIWFPR